MKTLFALVLLSTSALAADRTFDRTLNVPANPSVMIHTGSGNIRLHAGSDAQVHIAARLQAGHGWFDGAGDVDRRMQTIAANPPIQQNGGSITIGPQGHESESLYRNISIDYDVTLPKGSAITAGSGSGDIDIDGVGATLKAGTGSGNIHARGVRGTANLDTGSGDIELTEAASGDVRAQTGSGNIHVNGVSGGLRAGTGSGDITISGTPTVDWKLETGSGSMRLDLGSKAHFNLDASTGSGSVHTDQPITMQGSLDKHHVRGMVNGGGPTLRAQTGSGDIEIR